MARHVAHVAEKMNKYGCRQIREVLICRAHPRSFAHPFRDRHGVAFKVAHFPRQGLAQLLMDFQEQQFLWPYDLSCLSWPVGIWLRWTSFVPFPAGPADMVALP